MRTRWWCAGAAVAVLAMGTACTPLSSGSGDAGASGAGSGGASVGSTAGSAESGQTGGDDAAFCALAKAKAPAYLNVFDGDSSTPAERRAALANVDALTAAAPAALHDDFVRWDKVEHALLDAGTPPARTSSSRPAAPRSGTRCCVSPPTSSPPVASP